MNGIIYAAITVITGAVAAGIAHLTIRWLRKKADRTSSRLDDIILNAIARPLVVIILVTSVIIALTAYDAVPPSLQWIVNEAVIHAVYILIGAWIASVFLYNLINTYGRWLAQKTESDFDDRFIPLLEMGAKYLVWFVAFLLILATFRIDVTPFLAGAGIAGLAVALAAQDIIGNFLSGAIITIDKPFRIGDRIKFEDLSGDVISVGPRSTRIRTADNQVVTIPNSRITSNVVINYAMPDLRMKIRIPVSVAYGSDVKRVKEILLGIAREAAGRTPWVLTDPAPTVYFLEFGESSLNVQLVLWTNNYDNSWDVQDYVNMRIDERFREEGIEIPFRQIDVRMRSGEIPRTGKSG
jgi:MscS family membrane protein